MGFLTIADDLRHVGELLGVGSILFIGLPLLIAGSSKSSLSRPAALWVAGAIGIGAVGGALLDNMPAGLCLGLTVGVVIAVANRRLAEAAKVRDAVFSGPVRKAPNPRLQRTRLRSPLSF
jgi:hypothetical protein